MNDEQSTTLVFDYGITDPGPVIEKYNKADQRFALSINATLYEMGMIIKSAARIERLARFLIAHNK